MAKNIVLNPALKDLQFLVGKWNMELSNASFLPSPKSKVQGTMLVEWIEDGDYLVMRQGKKGVSQTYASWIIGSDGKTSNYTMLYNDNRKVYRVYQLSFKNNLLKIWRNSPKFSQRYSGKLSKDKKTIKAAWENSTNGKKWKHDFDVTYKRK